ncbi:MAG TPA: hypothetical protein VJN94_08760, partial [Candidatus Binataceae bacterium]|nr:hypothetical protein [Candidatus Binataceae bacterium]
RPKATAAPYAHGNRDPLSRAQELIYQAWDIDNGFKRVSLARKALAISADCAGAYTVLARESVPLPQALDYYRQAVAAGERALGKEIFQREAGHFWGIIETRPYMRARAGLAQSLWDSGCHDEALAHWHELLRLNDDDNQGIRYLLAARLLELGRDRELALLLQRHEDDGRAFLIWARALLLFRLQGDHARSCQALSEALDSNPHLPAWP